MRFLAFLFLFFPYLCLAQENVDYDDLTWPREMELGKYTLTMYQPQLASFEGQSLQSRMAVSIKSEEQMLFAAVWLDAKVSTDLDLRLVDLESIKVTQVSFPELDDKEREQRFADMLEEEIESWNIQLSLDHLIASMDGIEESTNEVDGINNEAPDIYYFSEAHTLVSIDGEPLMSVSDDTGIQYVINTPFFIVKFNNRYFIKNVDFWYTSGEILGPYSSANISEIPQEVLAFEKENAPEPIETEEEEKVSIAPQLLIVTQPSELIYSDGDAEFIPIDSTGLLYMSNTESDVLMHIASQEYFILIAGRWYRSKTLLANDWTFIASDELPDDFSAIPLNSDMASIRVSVSGTEEAKEAVLQQSIPQTATIDRSSASVEVSYDGEPTFEIIAPTSVSYAVNTDKTVLKIGEQYYCVDDAIWFVSTSPEGPWQVSETRPDEVDDLPADCPVYNVKYVYIYDTTPEYVYVGYYPGYTSSYVYHGVVVYGTGYRYPYWYRRYYYPRPVTYGFGVHYNPYSGWGFSVRIGVGWGFHPYSCWGPRGYHRGYRRGYYHGYRRGYNNAYKRGYAAGNRHGQNNNVYRNRSNGVNATRDRTQPSTSRGNATQTRASQQKNNMYTNSKGDVYQRKNDGSWENKSNANRDKGTQDRSNTQQQRSSNSNQQLNRDAQNRARGSQNYQRSNTQRSGGARGGGGRRR